MKDGLFMYFVWSSQLFNIYIHRLDTDLLQLTINFNLFAWSMCSALDSYFGGASFES
jgi:hypothetical protein